MRPSHRAAAQLNRSTAELAERAARLIVDRYAADGDDTYRFPFDVVVVSMRKDLTKLFLSVVAGRPALYFEYFAWKRATAGRRAMPQVIVRAELATLTEVIQAAFDPVLFNCLRPALDAGFAALDEALSTTALSAVSDQQPTGHQQDDAGSGPPPTQTGAETYLVAVRAGDEAAAERVVAALLDQGVPVQTVYMQVFQPAQREIGRLWQLNHISIAQEHRATAITRALMSRIAPQYTPSAYRPDRVVVACLGGELHDIGAQMVGDFLQFSGRQTEFCGSNTAFDHVVARALAIDATVIAISATVTIQLRVVLDLVDRLREGIPAARILVGGQAFRRGDKLWEAVGADAYAEDPYAAVAVLDAWEREPTGVGDKPVVP